MAGQFGPKATAVIAAEDKSRSRWAIVGAVATLAASIAILFLPGGVFIDAAIGLAIAGNAIQHAIEVGHEANTSMHVDDGLVSQSQAASARLGAVLVTVFAVIGVAVAGFRVVRVGLALRNLSQSMPELTLAQRAATARAIAGDRALVTAFAKVAPGANAAVTARVAGALEQAGDDVGALRSALKDVAAYAAIPRRVSASADAYESLRRTPNGSDIQRIAVQTGLTRAEVEAAKRHLMFDEHILVDNQTGALYRGKFEPFEEISNVWSKAARGDSLSSAEKEFMKKLVRHEEAEGALLSAASGRQLEQAFFRGELEGRLRTFLHGIGWDEGEDRTQPGCGIEADYPVSLRSPSVSPDRSPPTVSRFLIDDLDAVEDLLVQRYFVEVAYYAGVSAAIAPSAAPAHLLAGVGCRACAEPLAVAERLLDGDADPRADEGAGGLRVSPGTELPYDGFEHSAQSARDAIPAKPPRAPAAARGARRRCRRPSLCQSP